MAKLPSEVVEAIVMDRELQEHADGDHQETILRKLFRRVAEVFQAAATDNGQSETETSEQVKTCDNGECDQNGYQPAYGYPPAYGVPANVAVSLLVRVYDLLKELSEDSKGEKRKKIEEILEQISKALGIAVEGNINAAKVNPLAELKLAVTVSLGTQPVLDLQAAADQLSASWDAFVGIVTNIANIVEGDLFNATMKLRASIDCAVRSMRAASVATCNQGENDTTDVASEDAEVRSDSVVTEQTAERSDEQKPDNAIEAACGAGANASDANREPSVISDQSGNPELEAQANEVVVDQGSNGADQQIVLDLLTNMQNEIRALSERLAAVEATLRDRRRVTSFVASSSNSNQSSDNADDILSKWLKAKTDAERRRVLREAQSLLAKPVNIVGD